MLAAILKLQAGGVQCTLFAIPLCNARPVAAVLLAFIVSAANFPPLPLFMIIGHIMILRSRQLVSIAVLATLGVVYFWTWRNDVKPQLDRARPQNQEWETTVDETYFWKKVVTNYPKTTFQPLPTAAPLSFPKVQANFPKESADLRQIRISHQEAVKATMLRCWSSYKKHAWMADELEPLSGTSRNHFGGWAATLVDSLDTLWIMDLHEEFDEAVQAIDAIDFTHTDLEEVNIFETTIRYLGGFLAAFDLSEDIRLLKKAVQVGEMIYKAFDTPNHMPITRWKIHAAAKGEKQVAGSGVLVAEIGSLCMELTRLSQLTKDPKWFDAAQHITDIFSRQQDSTELPGLWPLVVDAREQTFNRGSTFTLGAMADSLYEYLPKMAALMGGQIPIYQEMYEKAMDTAAKHNFFRPMTPNNDDILVSGQVKTSQEGPKQMTEVEYQGQHLVCFLGGNLALGGKLFNRTQDIVLGRKLTDGCVYSYAAFPHGIMPETFNIAPCPSTETGDCKWDETVWKKEVLKANGKASDAPESEADEIIMKERLPKGFTRIPDRRYILRPEAIESVFMLYRITGQEDLLNTAWDMFLAIEKVTKTELANSAVADVTDTKEPEKTGSMESFWLGETLKYFYLIFSDPLLISLDDYVFNTEAHPFRRMK